MSDEIKDELKAVATILVVTITVCGVSYAIKKKILRDLEKAANEARPPIFKHIEHRNN